MAAVVGQIKTNENITEKLENKFGSPLVEKLFFCLCMRLQFQLKLELL